jgi:hypothetical protein
MGSPGPSIADSPVTFYLNVLERLDQAGVPFLVGGAYGFACYTGLERATKDFDLFLKAADVPHALTALNDSGWRTELPFPHWLAKVHGDDSFMDLIFGSGNGVAVVDDEWFEHAVEHDVLGRRLLVCPPEEMMWSKAFVQERERFDGADVVHLLEGLGATLDWARLLRRFADHWPVLLSHIVLFRFVYPRRREQVPQWVVDELVARFRAERQEDGNHVCRGTLLSREQYLSDVSGGGYTDARVVPYGPMTPGDAAIWTAAIPNEER